MLKQKKQDLQYEEFGANLSPMQAMQLCLDACSKLGDIMRSCLKEAASPQD